MGNDSIRSHRICNANQSSGDDDGDEAAKYVRVMYGRYVYYGAGGHNLLPLSIHLCPGCERQYWSPMNLELYRSRIDRKLFPVFKSLDEFTPQGDIKRRKSIGDHSGYLLLLLIVHDWVNFEANLSGKKWTMVSVFGGLPARTSAV